MFDGREWRKLHQGETALGLRGGMQNYDIEFIGSH